MCFAIAYDLSDILSIPKRHDHHHDDGYAVEEFDSGSKDKGDERQSSHLECLTERSLAHEFTDKRTGKRTENQSPRREKQTYDKTDSSPMHTLLRSAPKFSHPYRSDIVNHAHYQHQYAHHPQACRRHASLVVQPHHP